MRLKETAGSALEALNRHRLRSFLTSLGIIIGVLSVITIVAVGQGAQHMMQESLKGFGVNVLWLVPGTVRFGGRSMTASGVNKLTPEDAQAIARECPDVRYVAPASFTGGQLVYGNQNWSSMINGAGHLFTVVRDWHPVSGQFFTEYDVDQASKVCVLGRTVARKLFGREDPVGQTVRIKKVPFRVIGVLAAKGQTGWGQDQDDLVVVPYTTVMKKLARQTYLMAVSCTASSRERIDAAREQIITLLRRRHRIAPGAEADFSVLKPDDVLALINRIYDTLVLFLGSVAGIALLVGGIGIMNIMLVSVTERIREIGIRLAVGARGRDILLQFLLEAALLSTAGGVLGLLAGVGLAETISRVLGWPVFIHPAVSAISVLFSGAVGVGFGFLPAWHASQLDPIAALRHE